MTTKSLAADSATVLGPAISTRPLNLPTAEQVNRNRAKVYRDQIIGAAKAGKDESLDYWLALYVELYLR